MKVSDYIAKFINQKGISVVFEMAGGMITHILDSIAKYDSIKIVSMHHEQSASFAADAVGRLTGKPGIALATSGPGATNLLTGIGSCYFDSSPAIFITGQVNLHEQKGKRAIRQLGFQETDIAAMAEPITKAVFKIEKASEIPVILEKAYKISTEGRPGPVLIDIPMNIQRESVEEHYVDKGEEINYTNTIDKRIVLEVLNEIKHASNPLILAGAGIRAANAQPLFETFVKKTGVPVITSLLGLDTISYNSHERVGFIGAYGNRWANLAIGDADLLIVLGSRLDIRQTGADVNFFNAKKIIHVDIEQGEINNRLSGCIGINSDLTEFLAESICCLENNEVELSYKPVWYSKLADLKKDWPDVNELTGINGINPNEFMHILSGNATQVGAWIADVGNHQMWAAQSLEINKGQRFLTSGGMGAMGFSLPAAIGSALILNKAVVMIAGDGSFQLNIQELQTVYRNNLPIKMVVINNNSLGMIRQFQDSYFASRYQSTYWGYTAPDFEKVALAYQIEAKTISVPEEMNTAIEWLLSDNRPKLLQVTIDIQANAYPKIAFGKPITEMEPFAKPIAMEAT